MDVIWIVSGAVTINIMEYQNSGTKKTTHTPFGLIILNLSSNEYPACVTFFPDKRNLPIRLFSYKKLVTNLLIVPTGYLLQIFFPINYIDSVFDIMILTTS